MEMGTGKTKVLIDNLAMLYDKGKVDGALIIAPKGVVGTWYESRTSHSFTRSHRKCDRIVAIKYNIKNNKKN